MSSARRGSLLRWSLLMACATSVLNAFTYGPNGWRSPAHPELTYPAAVLSNFIGAIILGGGADLAAPYATSRWRAGLLGAPLMMATMEVLYWSLVWVPFTLRQHVAFIVLTLMMGFVGGFVLWEEDDEYYE